MIDLWVGSRLPGNGLRGLVISAGRFIRPTMFGGAARRLKLDAMFLLGASVAV
jgi:hypothetical protein